MNILSIENLTKAYGEKTLFKDISFKINKYDKIGLIGVNGTGKSTLLKVLADIESFDSGEILKSNNFKIQYLDQDPKFDPESTILDQIFLTDSFELSLIRKYEYTIEKLNSSPTDEDQNNLIELTQLIEKNNVWDLEHKVKTILTQLGIHNFNQKMSTLSGGQRKRVALASALILPSDLLILDEPTNHMDQEAIEWLETYLKNNKQTLLMVTHDRYFLDRVVTKTIELDFGCVYTYNGNYSEFLTKKMERNLRESAIESKKQKLYKKELEWIRTGAKARTTKQKARIQRFEELQDRNVPQDNQSINISIAHSRLGKKIIELKKIYKSFDDKCLISDFSYILQKEDRIGIIGKNGIGKSTLLNLIVNNLKPDSGTIDIGPTVKIGYFSQNIVEMNQNQRAIEYIREIAEYIETADGTKITAAQMLENFLFDGDLQWSYIRKLSGGEKRRLYLLSILMTSPNILILDEPTNDIDLDTLKILENYLDFFSGAVMVVSHDRYFLDRICNKIFAFSTNGVINQNNGNYTDYKNKTIEIATNSKTETNTTSTNYNNVHKPKLSYKEKLEFEKLPEEIKLLEETLSNIDQSMIEFSTDYIKLNELVEKKELLELELLEKMEREEYFEALINSFK